MNRWTTWIAAMLLACGAFAAAQEAPAPGAPPKQVPPGEEEELTPEKAMELLKDAHGLMQRAEELLNDSSRLKQAGETEQELLEKLQREFKDDPGVLQKRAVEQVKKLLERSEKRQKDAVEKMADIIKKARG